MERSIPLPHIICYYEGLYLALNIVSTFHSNLYIGLVLSYDQTWTTCPDVINSFFVGEWSTFPNTKLLIYFVTGSRFCFSFLCSTLFLLSIAPFMSYKLIVLSDDEEMNLSPSLLKHTPFIDWVCSYTCTIHLLSLISHILISPSCPPDINLLTQLLHLQRQLIPSECPLKLLTNGFPNIFYSLTPL